MFLKVDNVGIMALYKFRIIIIIIIMEEHPVGDCSRRPDQPLKIPVVEL